MTTPAAFESARVHVVHEHALPVDDVDLARHFIDLKAPLRHQDVRLLIVLGQLHALRRAVPEIPHELPVAREFEDAVLRRGAADPDESLTVSNHRLQCRGPERVVARTAPGVNHVAVLVQLDDLGSAHAAVDSRRVAISPNLITFGGGSTIQEPDVVLVIHVNTGDLLHAPPVRQRLRPEGIHSEDGRAILVC